MEKSWPFDSNVKIIDLTDTRTRPPIDVEERMEMLSSMLSDPKLSYQYENIKSVMAMYKTGAMPTVNDPWYFVNGKFFEEPQQPVLENLPPGAVFVEVRFLSILLIAITY